MSRLSQTAQEVKSSMGTSKANLRQNYYLNQKNIVIHSNDRNTNLWPQSNLFEVNLPNTYRNVQTIKVVNVVLPDYIEPTFSEAKRNVQFHITYDGTDAVIDTFQNGRYTPDGIANELERSMLKKLNKAYDFTQGGIQVKYDNKLQKLIFKDRATATSVNFSLDFESTVDLSYNNQYSDHINRHLKTLIYNKNTNWGIGSFLGFNKEVIASKTDNDIAILNSDGTVEDFINQTTKTCNYIMADFPLRVETTETKILYLEIENLNQSDEITPDKPADEVFTQNTSDQYSNSFLTEIITHSAKDECSGVTHFNPPKDTIQKLKFKLRHHDHSLVELENRDYTVVLQITCLEPDPFSIGRIRKPEFY